MDSSVEAELAELDDELTLKELQNQAEAAVSIAQEAIQEVNELREQNERVLHQNERLVEEIADLRERTNLLQALQRATSLKKDERIAVLLQTLHNEAKSNGGQATMDVNKWQSAVGGNPDRSLFYGEDGDAKRAVSMVDNEDVLWFEKENRGARRNSRLIIDTDSGSLSGSISGKTLENL